MLRSFHLFPVFLISLILRQETCHPVEENNPESSLLEVNALNPMTTIRESSFRHLATISHPNASNDEDMGSQTDSSNVFGDHLPENCNQLIVKFARITSDFTFCSLLNSIPYKLCRQCNDSYLALHKAYYQLEHISETQLIADCHHDILTKDKLLNIKNYFQHTIEIWTSGNCDKCYDVIRKDSAPVYIDSYESLHYFGLVASHENCISLNANTTGNNTCSNCTNTYHALTSYYDKLKSHYNSEICYDFTDSITTIRHHWNYALECYVEGDRGLPVLLICSIVIITPLIFYLLSKTFCVVRNSTLVQQKRLSSLSISHQIYNGNSHEIYNEQSHLINS